MTTRLMNPHCVYGASLTAPARSEALLTERKKHVNDFLRDGAAHGTEIPGGGEGHADDTQRHTTHRALEGDESHAAADVHELVLWLPEMRYIF